MKQSNAKTIGAMLPSFLISRTARNLRATTLMNYRIWARWMVKHWGRRNPAKVTAAEIEALCKFKSRNHAMMAQCFFRWLVTTRALPPTFDCGTLPLPPRTDERVVGYLKPEDAHRLLEAVKPQYQPAFILALYAGLRPMECARICWESIHVKERRLRVEARVSKIRRARIIEGVPPILWQLLKPHVRRGQTGRVVAAVSDNAALYRIQHERTRAAHEAEVTLGHDILRHTFATYYTALTGHPAMCSKVLGHYKLQTLAAHYDGVATKAEAREYFRGLTACAQGVRVNT